MSNRRDRCPRCPGVKYASSQLCAACRLEQRRAQSTRTFVDAARDPAPAALRARRLDILRDAAWRWGLLEPMP